eukprot:211722_1
MSTVFCTECGERNSATSNFCFGCGTRLQKRATKVDPKPQTQNETQVVRNETKQTKANAPAQVTRTEPDQTEMKQAETFHFNVDVQAFVPATKPKPKKDEKANANTKKGDSKEIASDSGASKVDSTKPASSKKDVSPKVTRKFCHYYGSAAGCKQRHCIFSHSNPNSVPFCKYFNKEFGLGCPYESECKFRHKIWGEADEEEEEDESSDDYHYGWHGEKKVVQISKLKHQLMKLATHANTSPKTETKGAPKDDEDLGLGGLLNL